MTAHREEGEGTRQAGASWRPLFRAGAVCAGIAVVLYLAGVIIVATTATPPATGGATMLEFVGAHRTLYVVRQLLWLTPSIFMMVVVLALAVALRPLGKSYARVAGVIAVVSWAASFAWPTTGDGSLAMVVLADKYSAVTTAAERTPFVAGAELLIALNDMPAVIGVLQTLGILLLSLLMLKGIFPKGLAWMGVATGSVGIVSEVLRPVLGWAYALYGLLLFAWLIWVAFALRTLAGPPSRSAVDLAPEPAARAQLVVGEDRPRAASAAVSPSGVRSGGGGGDG